MKRLKKAYYQLQTQIKDKDIKTALNTAIQQLRVLLQSSVDDQTR